MLKNSKGRLRKRVRLVKSVFNRFGLIGLWRLSRVVVGGLSRSFKVIHAGQFSDYQAGDLQARYGMTFRKVSRKAVRARLVEEFVNTSPGAYEHSLGEVLFFGGSRNNEREFLFLSDILAEDFPTLSYSREKNLAFAERIPLANGPLLEGVKKLLLRIAMAYSYRLDVNAGAATYMVLFLKSFVRMLMYFEQDRKRLPRLAVVANDHSVTATAFFSIIKFYRVPMVYLQHAEVNRVFPALRFDHNVLRNEHSLDIYRSVGKITGKAYLIPRDLKPFDYTALNQEIEEPVRVGIYLTSIVDHQGLRQTLQALRSNPFVGEVFVKPHPRTGVDNLPELSGVGVVQEIPEASHVALVGNSSIVLELLRSGIRVYNIFDLDDVHRDYYGFVENQLVPEVSLKGILDRFWLGTYLGPDWRKAIEYYNPSFGPGVECEIARFKNDIAKYFA